jgi:Ca-activated chloride channel family protein
VVLHDDHATGQVYFLALVAPPATHDRGRGVPREVVLLVDHSGSMQGAKWQAADWAVERFLSDLTERDAAALGIFHDRTHWFDKAPRQAGPDAVRQWGDFLKTNRDSGGTQLGVALEQALHLARQKGDRARHVLVITDAEVSDAGRILRLADEEAKRPDRRRISVLCIDAAPNALLATELAEAGGGVARFLTSDPQQEDITTALDEVLSDWTEPVLAGLRLEVNRPGAEAAGRGAGAADEAGWSRIDLGDLPAGRPVWVAARVPRGDGDLTFRVRAGKAFDVASCQMDLGRDADARPALKALFGARRVRGLEYLLHAGYTGAGFEDQLRRLGYDPAQVLTGPQGGKVYAENLREDAQAALKRLLVDESLRYGLACTEAAFVAVRTEAGRPVEGAVLVANALPAGWSEGFVGGRGAVAGSVLHSLTLAAGVPAAAPAVQALFKMQSSSAPDYSMRLSAGAQGKPVQQSLAELAPTAQETVVYSGVPAICNSEAVLFDSGAGNLPDSVTITALSVRFPDGAADAARLDPGLYLLLFVEDLAAPRARVRLADLVRQGGTRPVNVRREAGQVVRLVLVDPAGAWKRQAPRLEVALAW